jgi:tetratricopeptide (TPR) repeat protein
VSTVPNNSDLPSHSAAQEWLGKLYESLGRFSEAAEEYRLSLSLDPHNKGLEEELKRVQRK